MDNKKNAAFWKTARAAASGCRKRNPIGASCATRSGCVIKGARLSCSVSATFSLRGDPTRKHPRKPFNKVSSVGFASMSLVGPKSEVRPSSCEVCFAPTNGRPQPDHSGPFCAKPGECKRAVANAKNQFPTLNCWRGYDRVEPAHVSSTTLFRDIHR